VGGTCAELTEQQGLLPPEPLALGVQVPLLAQDLVQADGDLAQPVNLGPSLGETAPRTALDLACGLEAARAPLSGRVGHDTMMGLALPRVQPPDSAALFRPTAAVRDSSAVRQRETPVLPRRAG